MKAALHCLAPPSTRRRQPVARRRGPSSPWLTQSRAGRARIPGATGTSGNFRRSRASAGWLPLGSSPCVSPTTAVSGLQESPSKFRRKIQSRAAVGPAGRAPGGSPEADRPAWHGRWPGAHPEGRGAHQKPVGCGDTSRASADRGGGFALRARLGGGGVDGDGRRCGRLPAAGALPVVPIGGVAE